MPMQHAAGIGETLPAAAWSLHREGCAMTVNEFCRALASHPGAKMHWMLPDKSFVPAHYHMLFYLGTKHTACLAPEKCGVDGSGCC